ncbi:unnamed protein product [Boreogadus saida]
MASTSRRSIWVVFTWVVFTWVLVLCGPLVEVRRRVRTWDGLASSPDTAHGVVLCRSLFVFLFLHGLIVFTVSAFPPPHTSRRTGHRTPMKL